MSPIYRRPFGLCRESIRDYHIGKDVRSQEELVAEMDAAFFCQIARPGHLRNPAKLDSLNPKWVLKASKQARAG